MIVTLNQTRRTSLHYFSTEQSVLACNAFFKHCVPWFHVSTAKRLTYKYGLLLLLSFVLHGCASQAPSSSLTQFQIYQGGYQPVTTQSSLIRKQDQSLRIDPHWVARVNQHLQDDVETVHVPYREVITQIENLSVADSCSQHAHALVTRALSLNPSSIRARYLQMQCETDPRKKAQINDDMLAIAQVLLATGSGETPSSPIQIRELAEAYTLMSVLGWYVFDMELVVGADERIGYKIHALSFERDQFFYAYFSNHILLEKLYQSRTQAPLTNRDVSLITMRSFMSDHEAFALAFIGRNLIRRRNYQALIDKLEGHYEEHALLSVLYTEALLKLGRNKDAAELMGHIELKSTPGFIDGLIMQALVTQVVTDLNHKPSSKPTQSNQKSTQALQSISLLLQKIDYLTEQHTAIKRLIEQTFGHPDSQALLAFWLKHYADTNVVVEAITDMLYQMTLPVQRDEKLAILTMMHRDAPAATRQGDIAWMLGQFHHAGYGTEKNIQKAVEFYREAAEQGLPKAQTALGEIYLNGLFGFTKNIAAAERWLDLAIAQQHAPAKILKGNLLLKKSTQKATKQAEQLYREAIVQAQSRAYCELGMMYENAHVDLTLEEGIELLITGAEAGQVKCMFMLGLTYEVMQANYEQSRTWYLRAVKAGSSAAMSNLGRHYDHGIGVEADHAQALELYQQAIKAGNIVANVNLGLMYEAGRGVPQDYQLAATFFAKAAKHGNAQALHNLGIMYAYGNHFQQDLSQAFSLFDEAAAKGNAWSMFNLASAYRYGMGTDKNIEQAIYYFERAAEQGIADAFCQLSVLHHDYPNHQNLTLSQAYRDKANQYHGVNCAKRVSVTLQDERGMRHLVELSGEVVANSTHSQPVTHNDTTLTQMAGMVFKR